MECSLPNNDKYLNYKERYNKKQKIKDLGDSLALTHTTSCKDDVCCIMM